MYPRMRDGVSVVRITYEGSNEESYYVENLRGEEFEISYRIYTELLEADGTHPLCFSKDLIRQMKKHKILITSRYVFNGFFSRFVVAALGKGIERFKPVCRVINTALPFLTFLLFAGAIFFVQRYDHVRTDNINLLLYYLLIVFSVTIHECAHLIAGICYGCRFTEIGFLVLGFLPVGAYVAHRENNEMGRLALVQFSLAGIEANLLTAAILLLMSAIPSPVDTTLMAAACMSVVIAVLNLLPAPGLDGESALSAMLDVDSISKDSKLFIKDKGFRRKVLSTRSTRSRFVALFLINVFSTVLFGVLVGMNVVYTFIIFL